MRVTEEDGTGNSICTHDLFPFFFSFRLSVAFFSLFLFFNSLITVKDDLLWIFKITSAFLNNNTAFRADIIL